MSLRVKELLDLFASLTQEEQAQFQSLLPSLDSIDLSETIASERSKNGITCPHCGSIHVARNGRTNGKQRYVCHDCHKSFSNTTNSILASAKLNNEQIKAIFSCMIHKDSLRETGEKVGIHWNTAFLWRHKILDAIAKQPAILSGIIEADETFFRISYKGNHAHDGFRMPRKAKHHGERASYRGLSMEQVCVPCGIDRSGHAISKIACTGRVSTKALELVFADQIESKSTLITDKMNSYTRFAHGHGLKLVQLKADRKPIRKIYHIQTVNSYHSGLKLFMMKFRGVSTKHLNNYLTWYKWLRLNKSALSQKADELADMAVSFYSTTIREQLSQRDAVPVLAA